MPTTLISDSSHYTSVLDLAMNRHCRHQRPVCAAGENREAIPRGYGGTCFPMTAGDMRLQAVGLRAPTVL